MLAGIVACAGVAVGVVGLAGGAIFYLLSGSVPPPVTSPAPDVAPPAGPGAGTVTRPGSLTGTIRDEQGRPIAAPGARCLIGVEGISEKSGEKVDYAPGVRPDGTYEARLVDGVYHPIRAVLEVAWNGSSYRFDLDPVQDDTADRDSKDGIVQDFVWRLSGPHFRYRQNPDPKSWTHWYGASVRLSPSGYRNDLSQPVTPPPDGTRYSFTLEPVGKRIDGAEARTLTFERTFTGRDLDNPLLHDVPLAVYTLTGVELSADGQRHPLVFETSYAKFEPAPRVEFPMDEIVHGVHTPSFAFDRQR